MRAWILTFVFSVVGLTWAPSVAPAQESQPSSGPADALAAFKNLEDDFRARLARDNAEAAKVKVPEERERLLLTRARARIADYLPRFERIAAAARGKAVEIAAWKRVIDLGTQSERANEVVHEALQRLRATELDQPEVEDVIIAVRFLAWLLPETEILSFMDLVARRSSIAAARAAALFHASAFEVEFKDPPLERRPAIVAQLKKVIAEYPDSVYAGLAPGYIFDIERLQPGMSAPDLAAVDGAGRAFKLSDSRGKTTVLLFWSLRSRASLEVVEPLNRLYSELGRDRFEVIGVISDAVAADAARVEKAGVLFRNVFDGGNPAPIDRAWNVYAWPMVFVIDADGVIRKRHVQKRGLEEAVRSLSGVPTSAPSPGK